MKSKILFYITLSIILLLQSLACSDEDNFKTDLSDLESFKLSKNTIWDGSDGSGSFSDGNVIYFNTYYPDWVTFSGFAYSNIVNDIFYNDSAKFSSYPSGGANESEVYAVAHQFERIIITFKDTIKGEEPRYVMLANTTYAALAMKYGYGNTKKFGGNSGDDPDWFKVSIIGYPIWGGLSGPVNVFLADFRNEDNTKDYISKSWQYVNLSSLGTVKKIEFQIYSSDIGAPLYFCLDNFKGRIND
ncbi:MAG: hypothetical protein A2X13_12375 [Bacteroidetes bacterium GWC2_33_15]|nr:MAG: hypothetical protein A2X10_14320 [Bacteroidetes bacterium GWA2_33_15]OFX50587.1 MAG: hypothetical protein A2X13_12375 [Bacteroidetes bacterium GWC2_33_15]OFX64124.1 MAG: hypothetical protein A2X15_02825 [Bacteroidetes bacterium GWB2_32_14]OFX69736.1 MAG: hypothetical protein A2X14_05050 [Bacteroidetes bacterium GWD2_33_33]HAN19772.1 hypothetical protein [Bacteroidales bacterium]